MKTTRTFDEIFEQLHHLYKNKWIEVQVKKDGLLLSHFSIHVKAVEIRPLDDQKLRRRLGLKGKDQLGTIVIYGSHTFKGVAQESLNIPFKLGFDTMDAHFVQSNVSIESCGLEFLIRKLSSREVRTLSA